jgi:hypothetical protein
MTKCLTSLSIKEMKIKMRRFLSHPTQNVNHQENTQQQMLTRMQGKETHILEGNVD